MRDSSASEGQRIDEVAKDPELHGCIGLKARKDTTSCNPSAKQTEDVLWEINVQFLFVIESSFQGPLMALSK